MAGKNTEDPTLDESDLLKSLDELERLTKGDDLQAQDTEGGMSTEGSTLSSAAKGNRGGKPDLSKRTSASDMATSGADSSSGMEKGGDEDEDDESGDDDGSEDDESEEDVASKSFTDGVRGNAAVRQSVEVSDFCKGLVAEYGDALTVLEKALSKRTARLQKGLQESREATLRFNTRLAKALVHVGTQNARIERKLDHLLNQPNVPQRRTALSKSEVRPAPFSESDRADPAAFKDYLFKALSKAPEAERGPLGDLIIMAECNGFIPEQCGLIDASPDMQRLVKSFMEESAA